MAIKRDAASYSTIIQQKASTAFNGTLPTTTCAETQYIYKYPVDAGGGLVYWNATEPVVVNQLLVTLDVSGDVSIYLVNLDTTGAVIAGEDFTLDKKTGVTYYANTDLEVVLLPYQALKVVTTQAGRLQACGSYERTFQH